MNTALLTIDDVPSRNTPAIVDYLNRHGIQAVLFATGENVEKHYEEACYALRHGMIVGNHSYSHPAFSSLPLVQCIEEIERCETVLDKLYLDCGMKRAYRPFRFPYGDKGGTNKDALQQYLRSHNFHKIDDTAIPYSWWREHGMHTDIDTFWTFDFEEYRLCQDAAFTLDTILAKVNDPAPQQGTALFGANNAHFILMHAHAETEEILPRYWQHLIDPLLERGLRFVKPTFL